MDAEVHRACSSGDLETVRRLLREGADPHSVNSDHETLLHAACYGESLELVRYLVEEGGLDVNERAGEEPAPDWASDSEERTIGYTPLHVACEDPSLAVVRCLVEHGAEVNAADEEGRTALHIAADHEEKYDVFEYLLRSGGDVNVQDGAGMTPLRIAILCGNYRLVKLFIHDGLVAIATEIRELLHYACCGGNFTIFQLLLQTAGTPVSSSGFDPKRIHNGESYLHRLCKGKHNARQSLAMAKYLVEIEAEVDSQNCNNWTPLHTACSEGFVEMVRFLLDHNAALHATTVDGMSAAHLGVWSRDVLLVLLERGVSLELRDVLGRTPLFLLCSARAGWYHKHLRLQDQERLDIIRLLLERGADVNAIDVDESTPLHEICAGPGQFPELALNLVLREANVNGVDVRGRTPLHVACARDSSRIVEVLLENDAALNVEDADGDVPLHIAVLEENAGDIVDRLVRAGCDVNRRNARGKTPLHLLCHSREAGSRVTKAACLLRHGAQVNIEDRYSNTALENALEMCTNFQGSRCFIDTEETDVTNLAIISKILELPAKFPNTIYFRSGVMALFVRAGLLYNRLLAEYFAEAVYSDISPLEELVRSVDPGLRHCSLQIEGLLDDNLLYFNHARAIRAAKDGLRKRPESLRAHSVYAIRRHLGRLQPGYSILYRLNKLALPKHSILRQIRLDAIIVAIYPILTSQKHCHIFE